MQRSFKVYQTNLYKVQKTKPGIKTEPNSHPTGIDIGAILKRVRQFLIRAIERLTLTVAAADTDRALRQTILRISFDDHTWGQVQAPLGDFFGAAPGINPYESVPFSVRPNGDMICRFVMPFAKSCTIQVKTGATSPSP